MATNVAVNNGSSYVEWGSVIAGTVIAGAVSIVLLQFSQALGLTFADQYQDSYTPQKVFAIGLWLLWVQLMASMAGGYLAGRMRAPWASTSASESEIRDGVHGLLVWALSTVLAVLAAAIIGVLGAIAYHNGVDMAQHAQGKAASIPEALAHKYGIIVSFSAIASSLVSAVAAYWMATLGGDHRDGEFNFDKLSFRKKRSGGRR